MKNGARSVIYNSAVVNHEGHADKRKTVFRENRWTHVTLIAQPRSDETYSGINGWYSMRTPVFNRMLINGEELPFTFEAFQSHNKGGTAQGDNSLLWSAHGNGDRNSVRFGTPSHICKGFLPPRGNFSCDATVDEFFVWKMAELGEITARKQWLLGRYHKPLGASEGSFESGEIQFPASPRELAPPSKAPNPDGVLPPTETVASSASSGVEVLGMTWTAYGENGSDPEARVMDVRFDRPLAARVSMSLKTGASVKGPVSDDGFSPLSVLLSPGETVRYVARFEIDGLQPGSILLGTPVLDDVTILYRTAGGPLTEYYASVLAPMGGL